MIEISENLYHGLESSRLIMLNMCMVDMIPKNVTKYTVSDLL